MIENLMSALEDDRANLLVGDIASVLKNSAKVERALETLSETENKPEHLYRILSLAHSNKTLLQAAISGMQAARLLAQPRRQQGNRLTIYSKGGLHKKIGSTQGNIERRA